MKIGDLGEKIMYIPNMLIDFLSAILDSEPLREKPEEFYTVKVAYGNVQYKTANFIVILIVSSKYYSETSGLLQNTSVI